MWSTNQILGSFSSSSNGTAKLFVMFTIPAWLYAFSPADAVVAELYGGDAFPRAAVTEGMRRRAPPSLQPFDVGAVLATTLSVSKATLSFLVGRCSIRCREDDAEGDVGEVASALHAL